MSGNESSKNGQKSAGLGISAVSQFRAEEI